MNRPRPWAAFGSGLLQAIRQWPLWLPFYGLLLLLAGLLLWPLEKGLVDLLGHRLAAWEVADGVDVWWLTEALLGPGQESAGSLAAQVFFLLLPAWPFFLSLPFTLLSGGLLNALAGSDRTDWRRFGEGVRRYAGPFTLLLLLEVAALEVGLFLLIILAVVLLQVVGLPGGILVAGLVLVCLGVGLFLLLPWWFGYARVFAVLEKRRHVLQVLGRSGAFLWRNLGPAAGLELGLFFLLLLWSLLYALLKAPLPGTWWPALILLQQVAVLGRIGIRVVRFAGEVYLVREAAPSAEEAG